MYGIMYEPPWVGLMTSRLELERDEQRRHHRDRQECRGLVVALASAARQTIDRPYADSPYSAPRAARTVSRGEFITEVTQRGVGVVVTRKATMQRGVCRASLASPHPTQGAAAVDRTAPPPGGIHQLTS